MSVVWQLATCSGCTSYGTNGKQPDSEGWPIKASRLSRYKRHCLTTAQTCQFNNCCCQLDTYTVHDKFYPAHCCAFLTVHAKLHKQPRWNWLLYFFRLEGDYLLAQLHLLRGIKIPNVNNLNIVTVFLLRFLQLLRFLKSVPAVPAAPPHPNSIIIL